MTSASTPSTFLRTVLTCMLVGVLAYFGTIQVLDWITGGSSDPGPVEFDDSILTEEDPFVADLRAAAEIVRERWSYLDYRTGSSGLDFEALEEEAMAILQSSPDTPPNAADFSDALTHLISGLQDGHAFVLFKEYVPPGTHRWPFSLREVKEGLMIGGVQPGVEAVAIGDLLLAVDGASVEPLIQAAEAKVFASTPDARRRLAIRHIADWDRTERRTFTIRRMSGEEVKWEATLPPYYTSVPRSRALDTTRKHEVLEGDIAYFRPGDFTPPPNSGWPGPPEGRDAILADTYAEFDTAFGELQGCRALILDLRANPGGTDLLGQFLVDRMVEPGYTYYHLANQGNDRWGRMGEHGSTAPEGEHFLRVPTVCLVDEGTFSTADNVAACLEDVHPDLRFVGRPNGAGTGAPRNFDLPRTEATITFCTMQVQAPSGRMGEGIPVELDRRVTWTREDVLQDRDPDLAAALEMLR